MFTGFLHSVPQWRPRIHWPKFLHRSENFRHDTEATPDTGFLLKMYWVIYNQTWVYNVQYCMADLALMPITQP